MLNQPLQRSDLVTLMQSGEYLVMFKKLDGELREIYCTRDQKYLPATATKPVVEPPLKAEENKALPVYDLEKNSWRSFRLDTVVTVRQLLFKRGEFEVTETWFKRVS